MEAVDDPFLLEPRLMGTNGLRVSLQDREDSAYAHSVTEGRDRS
jgi:hypothetical protein